MRLGEILIERGKLDLANLERALRVQETNQQERIGAILTRTGFAAERDVIDALSVQLNIPVVPLTAYPELPILEERVSIRFIKESRALPLLEDEAQLVLAMVEPTDEYVLNAFRLVTGRNVVAQLAVPSELDAAFERLYGTGKTSMDQIVGEAQTRDDDVGNEDLQQLKELASEAPIIRLVSLIISHALQARASDIHIEPFENRLIVRYRVDGVMHEVESPPRRFSAAVISRIKIMASLDIAERRLPQDGRIKLRLQGKEIDLRVSTVPTMHGESVVMRILDKSGTALDFGTLGFDAVALERFMQVLNQPHGIVLVTGPTGSGKTTTLYAALSEAHTGRDKIITIEDPVEYQLPDVLQIPVNEAKGLTFARGLRSILRHDPDKIMVGEMRDPETAQIAIQAALTGHQVFATVHANNVFDVIGRLSTMGVDPYNLVSALNGVVAQRLVRVICPQCKTSAPATEADKLFLAQEGFEVAPDALLSHGRGCAHCGNSGYVGRTGIYELMVTDDALQRLIHTVRSLMLLTGSHNVAELQRCPKILGPTLARWVP